MNETLYYALKEYVLHDELNLEHADVFDPELGSDFELVRLYDDQGFVYDYIM